MLRINLEVYEGKRMRQVGELHVVNTRKSDDNLWGDYQVKGWYFWPPYTNEILNAAGTVLDFSRDSGPMRLAEQAITAALGNGVVSENGALNRGQRHTEKETRTA